MPKNQLRYFGNHLLREHTHHNLPCKNLAILYIS